MNVPIERAFSVYSSKRF